MQKASRKLGIKRQILEEHISMGNILLDYEGCLNEETFERIAQQKEKYIGIKAFLMTHKEGKFEPVYVKHRNKYIDYLNREDINFFNLKTIDSRNEIILYDPLDQEEFYFLREDIPYLNSRSIEFFEDYGYSKKEKVEKLLSQSDDEIKKKHVKEFVSSLRENKDYTESIVDFVDTVLRADELNKLVNDDINIMIDNAKTKTTGNYLRKFFNYVLEKENVRFGKVEAVNEERKSVKAYSDDTFINLAIMLFNEEFAQDNQLIKKALENHLYAEMWLFLALHFVCGWRASDICENWVYPLFSDEYNPLHLDLNNLEKDILFGKITDETYEKVSRYVIKKIILAGKEPSKTQKFSPEKLRMDAVLDLRIVLGLLTLIGVCHFRKSGDGLMRVNRILSYCNWVNGKKFFGDFFYETFGRHNIQTRRLNKSYLQGVEFTARELGNSPIVAHMVAAYARSHKSINTTSIYLGDHNFMGETPEDALFWMLQMGVLSIIPYTTLLLAFPESFGKLPKKAQSLLIQKLPVSAFDLETTGNILVDKEEITEKFSKGDKDSMESAREIIREMHAVALGKGRAKDKGTFCKLRALGCSCERPIVKSCIAAGCDKVILTTEAIPALISVVTDYRKKWQKTGDSKYYYAFWDYIYPEFKDIIQEIKRYMSEEEINMLDVVIGDCLNE